MSTATKLGVVVSNLIAVTFVPVWAVMWSPLVTNRVGVPVAPVKVLYVPVVVAVVTTSAPPTKVRVMVMVHAEGVLLEPWTQNTVPRVMAVATVKLMRMPLTMTARTNADMPGCDVTATLWMLVTCSRLSSDSVKGLGLPATRVTVPG